MALWSATLVLSGLPAALGSTSGRQLVLRTPDGSFSWTTPPADVDSWNIEKLNMRNLSGEHMTDDVVLAIVDELGGEEVACAGTTLQQLMADAGSTIYLRTPEGGAGGTIVVHSPTTHAVLLAGVTSPPLQEQGTAPPIAPPSPGSASYIPPPSPGVPASSPAGSTARALLQSPSHYELEDFNALDALGDGGSHDSGPAALSSQLREYAEKLRRLKAEVRAWQAAGNGVEDAHARARREKTFREALASEKAEAEAKVVDMTSELREMESQMLAMQQSATENAEIAGQWKERADSFESQLAAAKEAAAATESKWRSRLAELEERLETAQAERRRAEGAASRAGSPRSVGTGGGMPGSPVAMPSPSAAGARGGVSSPVPAAPTPTPGVSHSELLARSAQQEAALDTLERQVSELETELAAAHAATHAATARADQAEAEAAEASLHAEALANKVQEADAVAASAARKAADEAAAEHRESRAAAAAAASELARTQESLAEMTRRCRAAEEGARKTIAESEARETQVAQLQAQLESMQSRLRTAASEVHDAKDAAALARAELSETQSAAAVGKREADAAIKALQEQLASEGRGDSPASAEQGGEAGAAALAASRAEIAEKTKLVQEWEEYANHWEGRGREAEAALGEYERKLGEAEAGRSKADSQVRALQEQLVSLRSSGGGGGARRSPGGTQHTGQAGGAHVASGLAPSGAGYYRGSNSPSRGRRLSAGAVPSGGHGTLASTESHLSMVMGGAGAAHPDGSDPDGPSATEILHRIRASAPSTAAATAVAQAGAAPGGVYQGGYGGYRGYG